MRAAGGGGGTKTRPMDAEFQRYMDRLRSAVRLSDYLRRSLRLERRGREWAALCPFHEEKTPSFYVNDEKNFYHCFGCGAHGDAIGFLMQREGLRFIEAVERLGTESGLGPPPRRKPASPEAEREQDERVRLGAMLEEAAAWFSARLFEPGGREALAYLREARGVGEATAAAFRLGLAPEGGGAGQSARRRRAPRPPQSTGLGRAGSGRRRPCPARRRWGCHPLLPPPHHLPHRRPEGQDRLLRRKGSEPPRPGQVPQRARDGPLRQEAHPLQLPPRRRGPAPCSGAPRAGRDGHSGHSGRRQRSRPCAALRRGGLHGRGRAL